MTKRVGVMVLVSTLVRAVPFSAQVYQTGPAGLAQQMPRIYAPYLANMSRIKILQGQGKLNPALRGNVKRSSESVAPAGQPSPPSDTARPLDANQSTVFHPVGPPFVPQMFATLLGKTSQERQYIQGVLTACLNNYTDTARQKGVPLYDVARAFNYYIATNYLIYSEGKGPTLPQIDASQKMVRANLAQDETFQKMSDREKQEAYETLIVLAGFVDMGYGTFRANGNNSLAAPFREMAKQNLETLLGVPVERVHFTNEGLSLR